MVLLGRFATSVISAIGVLALSACGSSVEATGQDLSARAQLDRDSGQIITPFSAYLISDDAADQAVIDQARRVYLGKCMDEAGFSFTATMSEDVIFDDRRFGLWLEERAATYGYSDPPSRVADAWDQDASAGVDQWDNALAGCQEQFTNDPLVESIQVHSAGEPDRASELSTEAYRAAVKDPTWETAREPWKQCLRNHGLTAPDEPETWSSQEAKALLESDGTEVTEESIRLATIEARCNSEASLTQRLGDLVASYEQPLIDQHEAELKPLKEQKQRILQAARDYIAANA